MFGKKKNNTPDETIEEKGKVKPITKSQKEKDNRIKTLVFAAIFFAVATYFFVTNVVNISAVLAGEYENVIDRLMDIFKFVLQMFPFFIADILAFLFSLSSIKSKNKIVKLIGLVLTLVSLGYIVTVCILGFGVPKDVSL